MRIKLFLAGALLLCLLCGCAKQEWRSPANGAVASPMEVSYVADPQSLLQLPASPYTKHVYSHQGVGKGEWGETFASYDLAIAYGSRYIEQDLMISADGVLYCCHEFSPADITGETRLFEEMTSQEIDAMRTMNDGQCIPTLQAVFERYGTSVTYLVELKAGDVLVEPFVELVRQTGMEDHIIVQSTSAEILDRIEEVWPEMPKLLLISKKDAFEDALEEENADIIAVNGSLFNQKACDRVHEAGKQYCVYVIDDVSSIRKAIEIGADSYFTNYTEKALILEELYRKEEPAE